MFVGREKELRDLQRLYEEDSFQMFVLYGRRRVGKTTLFNVLSGLVPPDSGPVSRTWLMEARRLTE